jgi:hypothetical protein
MKCVLFNAGSSITMAAIAKCCPKVIIDILDGNRTGTHATFYGILF